MEEFLEEAKAQGLQVVDNSRLAESYGDYEKIIAEADQLCEIVDPEETPYVSKYKARDLLDPLCNRLEANRTIASLEKQKTIMQELDWRIATLRFRLGSIAWDVEEPHNTQVELELTAEYYTPGLVSQIAEISGELGSEKSKDIPENLEAPPVNVVSEKFLVEAMKCLNLLGILWAGRDHAKRSFLYLLASKQIYDDAKSLGTFMTLSPKKKLEMESTLTHNLFYLAQAYGNNSNAKLSAYYCQQTLQRQYDAGLDTKSGLEWVKNCMGMADFHTALKNTKSAAYSLGAAEKIYSTILKPTNTLENSTAATTDPDFADKLKEIEDDMNRRWITLDVTILKEAMERQKLRDQGGQEDPQTIFSFDQKPSTSPETLKFQSLDVPDLPLTSAEEVTNFELARELFLRAVTKLEIAKQVFPLDGFVTDHVQLIRQHSLLFHYLSYFEVDVKRKLAMELRRAELLRPFIDSLGRNAFEKLHKEISYELGEIYLNIFEYKLLKISEKNPQAAQTPEKFMKATDLNKCNEYCFSSIAMFQHFLSFYSKTNEGSENLLRKEKDYGSMSGDELAALPVLMPSWDLIAEEEVRPFLNAHFLIARMMSKILSKSSDPPLSRTKYMVCSLHRYQWLLKNALKICEHKQIPLNDVFEEEIKICREMADLLPTKIDRMHYLGEGGL